MMATMVSIPPSSAAPPPLPPPTSLPPLAPPPAPLLPRVSTCMLTVRLYIRNYTNDSGGSKKRTNRGHTICCSMWERTLACKAHSLGGCEDMSPLEILGFRSSEMDSCAI